MAEKITLARPYAKAIFEYADENCSISLWCNLLLQVSNIVENPTVKDFLKHPSVSHKERVNFILGLVNFDNKIETTKLENWLKILDTNGRLQISCYIYDLYKEMMTEKAGEIIVNVNSATEISDKVVDKIKNLLMNKFGKEPKLKLNINADLIGGISIKKDDMVIDGSILYKLKKLKQHMMS